MRLQHENPTLEECRLPFGGPGETRGVWQRRRAGRPGGRLHTSGRCARRRRRTCRTAGTGTAFPPVFVFETRSDRVSIQKNYNFSRRFNSQLYMRVFVPDRPQQKKTRPGRGIVVSSPPTFVFVVIRDRPNRARTAPLVEQTRGRALLYYTHKKRRVRMELVCQRVVGGVGSLKQLQ